MTKTRNRADSASPVATDELLLDFVDELIGAAVLSRVWLLFFDDQHRPRPLIIPVDDIELDLIDESGLLSVATLAGELARMAAATEVVVVWERPGANRLTIGERATVDALSRLFPPKPTRLRRQVLSHDDGVSLL
ncbi:hypothetical protein [Herbiconiux sp. YIM B11900]|uniref:hypothetical protein n=1 Tax=Herbiconiux sp. YIM B11900 TaxID=3404131 RepID=UPI003F875F66